MLYKKLSLLMLLIALSANAKELTLKDKFFITTINDIYVNLETEYQDTRVTFEGNLVRAEFEDPDLAGKQFPFVYRLGPGCCFNDAFAGMYIEYEGDDVPADNTWVRVSGYPFYYEHDGYTDLFLKADKLEKLDKPGNLTVKD